VLPYIHLPDLNLGPLPIHWFGILVATGVLVGIWLARRRAKEMGVDPIKLESLINWMLLCGFVLSHVLDEIFYHPSELVRRPYSILFVWEGLSSFGGFAGAAIGIFLWKRFKNRGQSLLPYADLILSVYPVAWIFGRMGCAVVHDHKGKAVEVANWFTVAFPDGPHYDLGLLEAMYAVVISAVCALMWRRKWKSGTYIAVTCAMYAPVRFGLDFLRESTGPTGDERYFGYTPAQWACVALFAFAIWMWLKGRRPPQPSLA
jgi:phosphatidylglycerol:prolipoprotein diacylglycerol transferase